MFRIGIDLGGTKTEVAALNSLGKTVFSSRRATPKDYASKIRTIRELVLEVEYRLETDSLPVGIGHPGSLNPRTQLMRNANSTELNGKPLQTDLIKALGRQVRCANDANCFALSEATDGAGKDASSVFGVIMGTGVGGGIVVNKKLLDGFGATAGEWGHTALPWATPGEAPGPVCKCGLNGCLESWISGPALSRQYLNQTGRDISVARIVASAQSGDSVAKDVLIQFYDRAARGLASIINILDPEIIVLGGGLSNIPLIDKEIEARLAHYVFSDEVVTQVRKNEHGDSSGVRGAAWLWPFE